MGIIALTTGINCSLVPRPPPRFYLAAVEKNQEKAWGDLSRDVCRGVYVTVKQEVSYDLTFKHLHHP